jgi:hypothetical protein
MSTPKNRSDNFRKEIAHEWMGNASSSPSPPSNDSVLDNSANASQNLQVSYGHTWQELGNSKADIGGPFLVVRRELAESNIPLVHNRTVVKSADSNTNAYNYLGSYYARYNTVNDSSFPTPVYPNDLSMDQMGTTAIARVLPTNPLVDFSVTLGELRSEGIPKLVGSDFFKERARIAKARDRNTST